MRSNRNPRQAPVAPAHAIEIPIEPHRVFRVLAGCAATLVALYVAGLAVQYGMGHDHVLGLIPLFDLDGEQTIPAFFSSAQLLLAAALVLLCARDARVTDNRLGRYWAALAAGFVYLATDEAIAIHERLNGPVARLLGRHGPTTGHDWTYIGLPAALLVGAAAAPLLRSLAPRIRYAFIGAGMLYVAGAVGMELVSMEYMLIAGRNNVVYGLLVAVEEGLEMVSIAWFIRALLEHLARPRLASAHLAPVLAAGFRQPEEGLPR